MSTTQYARSGYAAPPPGWAPPYQGPPPMPPGVMVNPQQWQMGSWMFNPAYNVQQYPVPTIPWMPGQAWPQHQQQANFNPYKKVIKPPSAEYLATKLSDNGLDLHNMIPIKNPYGDEEKEAAPQTPWIWNPATLSNDAISSSSTSNNNGPSMSNERPPPSRVRHSSEPPISNSNATSLARHATDPMIDGRTNGDLERNGSSSSHSTSSHVTPPFDRPVDRPKDPQFYARRCPEGLQPSNTDQTPHQGNPPETESEGFTTKLELKPTFSPKIIRTPGHYKNPNRSSSNASSREQSQGSTDSLVTRLDRMSVFSSSSSDNTSNLTRHSSMSSIYSSSSQSSISGVPALVDEPSSMLSPLFIANTPKSSSSRPIVRNSTHPEMGGQSALSTIVESPPLGETPQRRRSHHTMPSEIHHIDRTSPPLQDFLGGTQGNNNTHPDVHPPHDPPRRSSINQYTPPDVYAHHTSSSTWEATPRRTRAAVAPDIYRSVSPRRKSYNTTPPDTYAPSSDAYRSTSPYAGSRRKNSYNTTPPDTYPSSLDTHSQTSPPYTGSRRKNSHTNTPPDTYAPSSDIHRPNSPPYTGSRRKNSYNTTPPDSFVSSSSRHPISRDSSPRRTLTQITPPRDPVSPIEPPPNNATSINSTSPAVPRYNTYPDNPLPVPPRSRLKYMPMPPPPRTGPPQWKQLRRGFWNRRGDHITSLGYVVYAPPDLAYPDELKDYPDDRVGYKDDFGMIVEYDADRPELPESLPRHGQPPIHPYSEFVVYEMREVHG